MKTHWITPLLRKTCRSLAAVATGLTSMLTVSAATLYVWQDSPNPAPPYATWASAASSIQQAVDAAAAGDQIVVTNGVYATGVRTFPSGATFRLVVDKAVLVRSVNGPEVTILHGHSIPGFGVGDGAVRCLSLAVGATFSGFTVTNGATPGTGVNGGNGGGVTASRDATLTNCVIAGNWAAGYGGGVLGGTLIHCTVVGNRAFDGGGVDSCVLHGCVLTGNFAYREGGGANYSYLNHCTIVANSADTGGGVCVSAMTNCIAYYNSASSPQSANYSGSVHGGPYSLAYCCTTPLPAQGSGNITAEPELTDVLHISATSPCRGAGVAGGPVPADLDGEPRAHPPSMGCDEYWDGPVTGPLSLTLQASYLRVAVGFAVDFTGAIRGRAQANVWDFGDGVRITNRLATGHAWSNPGNYTVTRTAWNDTHPEGASTSLVIQVVDPVLHVAAGNASAAWPFSSWATAAATIQEAVDVAAPGSLVLVGDGVYATGGRAIFQGMTNRVALTKPVTVRSVNGPAVTIIQGYQVPGTTNGDGAVRCAYLTNGAVLSGFTLRGGATRKVADINHMSGGGVWCHSAAALVTNCTLTGNSANEQGGGAYSGTLSHCRLTFNWATNRGGGACDARLFNCVLTGNSAGQGGGSCRGWLTHCTIVGNSAKTEGGGTHGGELYNSIIFFNTTRTTWSPNSFNSALSYCCTPYSGFPGTAPSDPRFVDYAGGDLRLQAGSPCIDAGHNGFVPGSLDADGNPRIARLRVDMGAYEYQGPGLSPYIEWLQQHGLAVDGSADFADPDNDQVRNAEEWIADTDPNDALSLLRIDGISFGPPAMVRFVGSPRRLYTLNFSDGTTGDGSWPYWAALGGQVDVPGTGGGQTLIDSTPASNRIYRVSVRLP